MRIVHLCLAGMITEGWSYQENMLIKYHMKMGLEVSVITSQWVKNSNNGFEKCNKKDYIGEYGAHYYRLEIKGKDNINNRLKRYSQVYETLQKCDPDILFIHGCQFADIDIVLRYVTKWKPTVYVDNHSDFSNSAKSFLSKYLLHGLIWRYKVNRLSPYVKKFYGVLPARVDFLKNVYHLPENKCELLVMGADDEMAIASRESHARNKIRERYRINEDTFLIVTGGKIDRWKTQTLLLMKAVQNLSPKAKLLVFGSIEDDLKHEVEMLVDGHNIQYLGWISTKESYDVFEASDLAVFPGRHSVYWEQATGQGLPLVCKDWTGTHHVDLGGNVKFLTTDSSEEIEGVLKEIIENHSLYNVMKKVAVNEGIDCFSYSNIARRAIDSSLRN